MANNGFAKGRVAGLLPRRLERVFWAYSMFFFCTEMIYLRLVRSQRYPYFWLDQYYMRYIDFMLKLHLQCGQSNKFIGEIARCYTLTDWWYLNKFDYSCQSRGIVICGARKWQLACQTSPNLQSTLALYAGASVQVLVGFAPFRQRRFPRMNQLASPMNSMRTDHVRLQCIDTSTRTDLPVPTSCSPRFLCCVNFWNSASSIYERINTSKHQN